MQAEQKAKTASQRIEELENVSMSLYQTVDNMARDLMTIKEAVKLLGNKVDAIVKASTSGGDLSDTNLAKIMVENNVEDLREKVSKLIGQGFLVPAEETTVDSFMVGRELSEDGIVQNPRIQFVVSSVQEELRAKLFGTKVGDVIDLKDGKWKFEVMEIYSLQNPQAPTEAPEQSAEPTENTTLQ